MNCSTLGFPVLHYLLAAAAAKSLQSCPTLCDPMDCSPPDSSVHGICQARVLEWVAIASWLKLMCIELVMPSILSAVAPFSSCLQSFPASESFPMSWLFTSGGQSIGTSTSVLPVNIQGWFPLGLTGLLSLLSKGLSRVFIIQHHNSKASVLWHSTFFMAKLSHPYMTARKTIVFISFTFTHLWF